MRREDARKLDRLLAGGDKLSVQEKEEAFQTILTRVATSETPSRARAERSERSLRFPLFAALSAAAAVLAVVVGVQLWNARPSQRTDDFSVKGAEGWSRLFTVECIGGDGAKKGSACTLDDTLAFRVSPDDRGKYFSAAALGTDGALTWYFPSAEAPSVRISEEGVVDLGALLRTNGKPGAYVVYGAVSDGPLSKAEMREAIESLASGKKGRFRIETRPIEIEKKE